MPLHDGALGDQEGGEGMTAMGGEGGDRRGGGGRGRFGGDTAVGGVGSFQTFLYYDRFREIGEGAFMPSGVFDLDKIKKWGKSRNWCMYHLIRRDINRQSVVGRDDDSRDGSRWGV